MAFLKHCFFQNISRVQYSVSVIKYFMEPLLRNLISRYTLMESLLLYVKLFETFICYDEPLKIENCKTRLLASNSDRRGGGY